MKRTLVGVVATLFLALTLGFAQSGGSGSSDTTTGRDNNQATTQTSGTQDGRHNWGWIGLLGLAGLAGLRRNNQATETNDRNRNASDMRRAA